MKSKPSKSEIDLPAAAERCSVGDAWADVVVGTAVVDVGVIIDADIRDIACSGVARDTASDVTDSASASDETSYTVLTQELLAIIIASGSAAVSRLKIILTQKISR